MATTTCQSLWLRSMLANLTWSKCVKIFVDNRSAITLMKNVVFHRISKNNNTWFHFIRNYVEKFLISVEYVSGEEQKANILTKALPRAKFARLRCQTPGRGGGTSRAMRLSSWITSKLNIYHKYTNKQNNICTLSLS